MTKTFWLSFINNGKHAGCCVIDVTELEAAVQKMRLDTDFPNHLPGAEWTAAASAKAWRLGCNPGGQMASYELPPSDTSPRNRLMQQAELEQLGLI